MIHIIHNKVRGRVRFKVEGLFQSDALKEFLESTLNLQKDISEVSASTITGNLLVFFNSDYDTRRIETLVEKILSAFREDGENRPGKEPHPETANPLPAPIPRPHDSIQKSSIKQKFKHALFGKEVQREEPWHTIDETSTMVIVKTDRSVGLSHDEVATRIKKYGPNSLPEPESRSKWDIMKDQFMSLPVGLLGVAAGVSIMTGGFLDAAVIMGVVVANGVIGYYTESEAERTIQSLKKFVRPQARVIRSGKALDIPAEEVVVGDMVVLKPGFYIPADCRVVESSHLSIDESVLTGESMPVFKTRKVLKQGNTSLGDRVNMAYMGTLVTGGEGLAVVVATGRYTEMGRLQILLSETTTPETPIEKQLRRIGDQLVIFCMGICGVVFLLGFVRGYGMVQMLRMAISLADAAVPEGLPAAATINFALGINKMKKHRVLVRHLQAIETLGAVQTVCLDKTGTITLNRMTLLSVYTGMRRIEIENGRCLDDGKPIKPLEYEELRQLIYVCALCSDVKINGGNGDGEYELSGSSTEIALINLAISSGVDIIKLRKDYKLLKVKNRAEDRLYMSTLHTTPNKGGKFFAVKGSPPAVLNMCDRQLVGGRQVPLTEEDRLKIETENERMASEALRVLGVACAEVKKTSDVKQETGLTWVGLAGLADPIRAGAEELIQVYHHAGIETVMITGDQSPTAYAVAEKLHLNKGERPIILDSTELIALDEDVMEALAKQVDVYSRVSPAHKLRIVQALQSAGKVVAMTGDGINDGPALKAADIGIAMGKTGTDVAREVADVVLEEDNLETLIIAVRDGRTTYSNIRKSVRFFLSTNLSEIMLMFSAMAIGIGFPLTVMQLLWINLISDIFPGLALSMEKAETDVLDQAPRDPEAPIVSKQDYKTMALESGIITAGALGAYGWGIALYGMGPKATTIAFQGLTLGQLLHAVSCRSEKHSIFDRERPKPNRYFDISVWGSVGLQVLTMIVPGLRSFLGLAPVNLMDAAVIGGSALIPLGVNESMKTVTGEKP